MSSDHIDDLRAQAQHARERYQLYKAKAYGPRPTSPERLRELQRAYEQAQERLSFAEAEERRAQDAESQPRYRSCPPAAVTTGRSAPVSEGHGSHGPSTPRRHDGAAGLPR